MTRLMRKHPLLARLALATAFATVSPFSNAADDFVRDSIPNKWINPIIPEQFEEKLEYPTYFKDLDRARLEAFTGRYKMSLLTLKKAKDADPVQVALVRATAQSAIGQKTAALESLSGDTVRSDPKCQILKARILSDLCRHDEAVTLVSN